MTKQFIAKEFKIPALKGISEKNIQEHLKLYAGYVKHANLIQDKIAEYKKDMEKNAYALAEVSRRFGFEYNGIRNHELYFSSFEGGANALDAKSALAKRIADTWGSLENWQTEFKALAMTRGVGWAILYYDATDDRLLNAWIDEQHLGQLQACTPLVALDMWEHSFVADYQPSGRKNYLEDFFANLNWKVAEKIFSASQSR
jgi:Fe-Mn family superoxide dismutase